MLQFLSERLAQDRGCLGTMLEQFAGHPTYGTT